MLRFIFAVILHSDVLVDRYSYGTTFVRLDRRNVERYLSLGLRQDMSRKLTAFRGQNYVALSCRGYVETRRLPNLLSSLQASLNQIQRVPPENGGTQKAGSAWRRFRRRYAKGKISKEWLRRQVCFRDNLSNTEGMNHATRRE